MNVLSSMAMSPSLTHSALSARSSMRPTGLSPEMPGKAPENSLVLQLPAEDRHRLRDDLEPVLLHDGQVLCEAGARQHFVYFPTGATLSLMSFTQAGETCELISIRHDGLAGLDVALGSDQSLHRLVVQRGGAALRLRTSALRQALGESDMLRRLVMQQMQLQLLQLGQGVVCHSHHSITERLCFWLLSNTDQDLPARVGMTHEAIASLLGVRRESVTQAAGRLQAQGLITTRRGQITVHDREGLSENACECHARMQAARERLLRQDSPGADLDLGGSCMRGEHEEGELPGVSMDRDTPATRLYRDLYEFAPVGFVTLDHRQQILQTNLAAAILLGASRTQLEQRVFSDWLEPHSREAFARFHAEVLSGRCRRHCDVSLIDRARGRPTQLRIQASTDEDGEECRMVMMDLSEGLASQDSALQTADARPRWSGAQGPSPAEPIQIWTPASGTAPLSVAADDNGAADAGADTHAPGNVSAPASRPAPAHWLSGLTH